MSYQHPHPLGGDSAALYHAARAGQFPQHLAARIARDLPTLNLSGERAYLEWYGEQLFLALAVRGDHHGAQANLQNLATRLVNLHSKGLCPPLTQYLIEEVCSIKTEIGRRAQGRFGKGLLPGVFGAVLAAIMLCQREGFGFDAERIISLVRKLTGASRTDIKNAILHYTRDADLDLSDWLVSKSIPRAALAALNSPQV